MNSLRFPFAKQRPDGLCLPANGRLSDSLRRTARTRQEETHIRARGSPARGSRLSGKDAPAVTGPGHERKHFVAVYPLSDRHVAADGGHPVRWPRLLSAAAGRAAAAGRLPDHPGHRDPAGRQPRNHGLLGGAAAGAAARADPRHRADDLDELARLDRDHASSSTSIATSTAPPTTSRARSTPPAASCRRTFPRRRPIARSIRRTRRSCCCRRPRTRCR